MISIARDLIALLQPDERRRAAILLGLVIVLGLVETLGVASIMPLLAVIADPAVLTRHETLRRLVAMLGNPGTNELLFMLGLGGLAAIVLANAATAAAQWGVADFAHSCAHSISRRLLGRYLQQPYPFFLGRNSSELANNILGEVAHLVRFVVLPAVRMAARIVVSLFILGLLLLVDPFLTLVAIVVLGGAYGGIYAAIHGRVQRMGQRRLDAEAERFRAASEAFLGIKEIKLFGCEEAYLARYDQPSRRAARYYAVSEMISTLPRYALEAVAFGGILAALLYLIRFKGGFEQAMPVIGIFALAGQRLLPSLQQIFLSASLVRFGLPTLTKITNEFRETGTAAAELAAPAAALALTDSIELQDIRFRYAGAARPAIDGISLRIRAGSSVALVGSTGSGKTTLVDLLCGLLAQDSGQILIDGEALDDARRRRWRHSIGYVPQSIYLIDDTVARNIAFGVADSEIDQARVEAAARLAWVHDLIVNELPTGYATMIGDNGVRLSGGQRQRLGIARALYHDPPLIVLDEATSALDNATESAVMDAVNALARQKTVVIIAHRLTTVRRCDEIFVLEAGRIAASGNYETLLRESGVFRDLSRLT